LVSMIRGNENKEEKKEPAVGRGHFSNEL
jgi:hypothetical protein